MDPLSILCILIGLLIIVSRGPMIFAPQGTLRFYHDLVSTDARVRWIAVGIAALAAALVALPLGEGAMAGILRFLGWLWVAAAVWLLVQPSQYRSVAGGVVGFLEHSTDEAVVRLIGVLAVGLGIALILYGYLA